MLLQLCVFGLGGDENGNVRVGVFPEGEKILIGGVGFYGVALDGIGSADLEMCECADGFIGHDPAMSENFLELRSGFGCVMRVQIQLTPKIRRVESDPTFRTQLIGSRSLK